MWAVEVKCGDIVYFPIRVKSNERSHVQVLYIRKADT